MRRWAVLVVIAVVIGWVLARDKMGKIDRDHEAAKGGWPDAAPDAVPPPDRSPKFYASHPGDAREPAELAAARSVLARCSADDGHRGAWVVGSVLEGTFTLPTRGRPDVVNVSAKNVAGDGNVLWYQVTLDARGVPRAIRANKRISAAWCAMDRPDADEPL